MEGKVVAALDAGLAAACAVRKARRRLLLPAHQLVDGEAVRLPLRRQLVADAEVGERHFPLAATASLIMLGSTFQAAD